MANPQNYTNFRDFEYERMNVGYDGQYPEGGTKCKNYELCEQILPLWWYECTGCYLCTNCDIFGWKELEFRDSSEECSVCCETTHKQVKFPTNCGHWFCVLCSRNILFWDETRYHLSPVKFGCPPCPNGCVNPEKGKQCYCEEYDETIEQWKNENPDKYDEYNDAEDQSIELSETVSGSVFGSKTCPMCRAKYKTKYSY